MSLEDDLRTIQTQRSAASAKVARATVEYDNATTKLQAAKNSLKEEFGVETNDEAKAMLTELNGELQEALEEVRTALTKAGA